MFDAPATKGLGQRSMAGRFKLCRDLIPGVTKIL